MAGPQGTFTAASDGPGSAAMASIASSFASEFSQTTGGDAATTRDRTSATSTGTTASATGADASTSGTNTSPTTFATSVTTGTAGASSSMADGTSGTASNAASNTSGAVTVSQKSCDSLSCSSALKAAVAVPIIIAAIAGILLFFYLVRRRRRRAAGAGVSEKKPKKAGKKWSRHLRAFSFDAELLMGGRFSSTNSVRSRDPSVRSAGNNSRQGAASAEPSLHSIEEVAPPYRDAVSHGQPLSPTQNRSVAPIAAGGAATDPILRAASTATAPPPYRAVAHQGHSQPASPISGNPFADSAPVSPIEDSPFNDPPGERPTLSRGSSLYQSVNTEDGAPSDAGSIQEAQIGRRVSVRNSGAAPSSGS
ncbi:hypothetical protein PV05_07129 [Exophiala xenobiotica]|uniref:Uncharacterized protein n=1 Tax=Exophiala xenobiotica TaxID=348802 RepID=A0A0D2EH90_9EURO|nr:uncharacterized protein PV05_07129 [Exophiala xenobiotica]KIW54793.1 hypothetical protein PV05_07129 [Exophiala xenobiotica]